MKLGILGNKIGMTQIFNKSGSVIPVTIIKAGPCIVTQIKTELKEKYNSIQIGYKKIPIHKLNQPQLGHLQKNKIEPLKYTQEFKTDSYNDSIKVGDKITVDNFAEGEFIDIKAKTIGKGFSGLQKKHKFSRGPMTHGSKNHRAPGSIGMGTTPGRVLPGKKMAGQLGNKIITIKRLKIVYIDTKEDILVVKGSVPGKTGNILKITLSK